jgi:hypothetical protein
MMTRWERGEAKIERLIAMRELEHVTGAAADGTPLLAQARKTAALLAAADALISQLSFFD